MSGLITTMFENFSSVIVGLAGGIKDGVANLVYVDPKAETKVLSDAVMFIFTIAGVSIAMTVFFMVFRLIRFGRQR